MKKLPIAGLVCISLLGVMTQKALSHSVQTDYLLSPQDGLSLDVTFSTGEPHAEAPVKIYSPDNPDKPWFEGKTDKDGKFNFQPDKTLEGEWTVEIGEFSHADILSVPVKEEGIQIDHISREQSETLMAQPSLSVQTLPAQANSLKNRNFTTSGLDVLLVGTTVLGGLMIGKKFISRKS